MQNKKVYHNGRFHTLDINTDRAEAIAVINGIISEVGSNSNLKSLHRDGYELVDLGGKCVIPGIIDAHLHLLSLGRSFHRVNLDGVASLNEVERILRTAASKLGKNQWLIGRGWNKNLWGDDFPNKDLLDRIYDGPVALNSKDGHLLWVNSAALKFCGIDETTPDPAGGVFVKDDNGSLTGILKENAVDLFYSRVPPEPLENKIMAVKSAQDHLLKLGIIGAGDCDEDHDLFSIYSDLENNGDLKLRIFKIIPRDFLLRAIALKYKTGEGSDHYRIGALKLFADGALGSQTAYMFEPYDNSKINYGVETLTVAEIEEYVKRAADANISVAIHAIGDKANYQALTGLGKFADTFRKNNLRPRVEHAQLLRQSDIDLFKRYSIIASVQPIHATSDRDTADKYWGARSRYAYPFKTLLESGSRLAFGSDAPIETANPLAGIHAAVTRQRKNENRPSWYAEEKLSVPQAVEHIALVLHSHAVTMILTGIISVGKRADFVVLSDNIFEMPPDTIADVTPLMTVIDGQIAYKES